jgi:hypothetical protein
MKKDFERFNFNHCLNYNIHTIILITTYKPFWMFEEVSSSHLVLFKFGFGLI